MMVEDVKTLGQLLALSDARFKKANLERARAEQHYAGAQKEQMELITALSNQLGDEETTAHRVSLATLAKLLAPLNAKEGGADQDKQAEEDHTKTLCAACEASLSQVRCLPPLPAPSSSSPSSISSSIS